MVLNDRWGREGGLRLCAGLRGYAGLARMLVVFVPCEVLLPGPTRRCSTGFSITGRGTEEPDAGDKGTADTAEAGVGAEGGDATVSAVTADTAVEEEKATLQALHANLRCEAGDSEGAPSTSGSTGARWSRDRGRAFAHSQTWPIDNP